MTDQARRIAELEDKLKIAEREIADLRAERDELKALVERQNEHVVDNHSMVDQWISAFGMVVGDDGKWTWNPFVESHNEMMAKYNDLIREWNKFIGQYNVNVLKRDVGRPLAASDAQARQARRMHKAGQSLRAIAAETSLGLRTVRTIIEKDDGTDRTSQKYRKLHKLEVDRAGMNSWEARKRTRDALPRQINAAQVRAEDLQREAKGLSKAKL